MFDQTAGITTNGLVAMDFDNFYNAYDSRIADDFTVPAGETWYIDSVSIYGFYNGTPDSAGMNFTIYDDNNGSIGALVFSQIIEENLDPGADGTITAHWTTPNQLTAGTYWMAASARKNYLFNPVQWYWYLDSLGTGSEAHWENPNGGFAAGCTSWTPVTDPNCVDQDYDGVSFQIFGCYGPTKPTINELPEDTTFCYGPSFTMTASSNSSGVMFAWNTGDSSATISVTEAGTYVVTAYDPTTLCGATSNINLNILPEPVSNVENDTICEGQSRTFISACATCSFVWNDGSTSNNLTVDDEGWVSVTMTDNVTGCVGVDSGWLEIVPLPSVDFIPDNPAHGCLGDTFELGTAKTYSSYFWNKDGWNSLKVTPTIMVYEKGDYYLTVTNSLGCIITDTVEVQFHHKPQPTYSTSYAPVDRTRVTAELGYQTYKWSNGQTDNVILVSKPGAYSLTVTDEFGCVGVVDMFITVVPAGVSETLPDGLSVFPNPANATVTIETNDMNPDLVKILDINGRVVSTHKLLDDKTELPVSRLPNGTYEMVIYRSEEVMGSTSIIIQH
ncbi:MAG: hypothetical protein Salg2KO_08050 [Salibacteraceae bacterium]